MLAHPHSRARRPPRPPRTRLHAGRAPPPRPGRRWHQRPPGVRVRLPDTHPAPTTRVRSVGDDGFPWTLPRRGTARPLPGAESSRRAGPADPACSLPSSLQNFLCVPVKLCFHDRDTTVCFLLSPESSDGPRRPAAFAPNSSRTRGAGHALPRARPPRPPPSAWSSFTCPWPHALPCALLHLSSVPRFTPREHRDLGDTLGRGADGRA